MSVSLFEECGFCYKGQLNYNCRTHGVWSDGLFVPEIRKTSALVFRIYITTWAVRKINNPEYRRDSEDWGPGWGGPSEHIYRETTDKQIFKAQGAEYDNDIWCVVVDSKSLAAVRDEIRALWRQHTWEDGEKKKKQQTDLVYKSQMSIEIREVTLR